MSFCTETGTFIHITIQEDSQRMEVVEGIMDWFFFCAILLLFTSGVVESG